MMCYRDRTFCNDEKCAEFSTCPTAFTKKDKVAADKWWGKAGAPVAFYASTLKCFKKKKVEEKL
jgi:hypothetical protein